MKQLEKRYLCSIFIKCMNYKSHVKKKKLTYTTVGNFIEDCSDNRFNNLRLTIFDCLNNVEGLTDDNIDNPLPKKEKFWIRILVTQHHGLNSKDEVNRKNQCKREKLNH